MTEQGERRKEEKRRESKEQGERKREGNIWTHEGYRQRKWRRKNAF